jgi:hypothetical protein
LKYFASIKNFVDKKQNTYFIMSTPYYSAITKNFSRPSFMKDEYNIMAFNDEALFEETTHDALDDSSTGSKYQQSFTSIRTTFFGFIDTAFSAIRENIESEIEVIPSIEEVIRTNVVRTEKLDSVRSLMDSETFRDFKKEMQQEGMITTNAIGQQISQNIGKRASMDLLEKRRIPSLRFTS